MYRTVLGIDSCAPAFAKVRIEPYLGALKKAAGKIPHPQGELAVDYELKGSKWDIEIYLPGDITGSLIWKDQSYPLKSGGNEMVFEE